MCVCVHLCVCARVVCVYVVCVCACVRMCACVRVCVCEPLPTVPPSSKSARRQTASDTLDAPHSECGGLSTGRARRKTAPGP